MKPLDKKDLDLLAAYPGVPIIDGTSRKRAKQCPRLGEVMNHPPFGRGLRPHENADVLNFGTAIHDALDFYYEYENLGTLPTLTTAQFQLHGLSPELNTLGTQMLDEYLRVAPGWDDFEVVMTEHAGLVPIREPDFEGIEGAVIALYYFRSDGIIRDNLGRLWLLEHKTANRWWTEADLQFDEQLTAYLWAEQQWFGEPFAGVLLNVLLKEPVEDPDILKNGLPTTSMSRLGKVTAKRYEEQIADLPVDDERWRVHEALQDRELGGLHPTIRRFKPERSQEAIAKQAVRIQRDVIRLLSSDRPGWDDPHIGRHCTYCPMMRVCLSAEDDDNGESLLETFFAPGTPMWEQHSVAV